MKAHSSLLKKRAHAGHTNAKNGFLAAEDARACRNDEAVRRTVGQRNPLAIPRGAAANYPAALTCASHRLP
jgi:hypothetical protein